MRYIGANPNNYVYFNCDDNKNPTAETCELWRIIGIINNVDDGTGNLETRFKIIRDESIGKYSWDTSDSTVNSGYGINEWSQADVMKLMNPGYEDEAIGGSLYWSRGSGTCYNGQSNVTTACNFSESGLKESSKSMIGEAMWYTGSNGIEANYANILTSKFYELERSSNIGKTCASGAECNDTVSRTTVWKGKVGLMYPSDYGYATSGGTTTNRETCLNTILYDWSNSGIEDCKNNNWIYDSKYTQWTITPLSFSIYSDHVFHIDNVNIINGKGTISSPFELSIQ